MVGCIAIVVCKVSEAHFDDQCMQADTKKVRNLRKKIRQCEELLSKQEDGVPLSNDQLEKLARLEALQKELASIPEEIVQDAGN